MMKGTEKIAQKIANECFAVRTRLLGRVVTAIYDDALRPVGMTVSQVNILTAITHRKSISPTEICKILKMEKSTLSRNAERMERNGWVKKESGEDGRSYKLRITKNGEKLLRSAFPYWKKAQQEMEKFFGNTGAKALQGLTRKIWRSQAA